MVKSSDDVAPFARGFPPVAARDARVLILGSLPGEKSIAMQQYYAQHRNAFWRIAGELFGAEPALAYADRLERLREAGVALWDVLAAGERRGSLDSAIVPATIEVNDFPSFFTRHPRIRLVCFNGRKAEELYRRHVLPVLPPAIGALDRRLLPSTSPAHAARSYEQKLALWAEALAGHAVRKFGR